MSLFLLHTCLAPAAYRIVTRPERMLPSSSHTQYNMMYSYMTVTNSAIQINCMFEKFVRVLHVVWSARDTGNNSNNK